MSKIEKKPVERRKYIRLQAPIKVFYTNIRSEKMHSADVKDISAEGIRFQTEDKGLSISDNLELKLDIPGAPNAVHIKGVVVWKDKMTLEDDSPYNAGVEFGEIEDDNKNTFLKYLCDLIYNLSEGAKHAGKKKA